MKEYIVGIDFGHGETSAWIVPTSKSNGMIDFHQGESLRLKSANTVSGRSCYSLIRKKNSGEYVMDDLSGNPIGEFKAKVSVLNEHKEQKEAYSHFIKVIYKRLLEKNTMLVNNNGNTNFDLCIACPTKWNTEEKDAYLHFFNEALKEFGVEVLSVVNESDAAFFSHGTVQKFKDKCVLIIDYGSSTIDYTVMNNGKKISDDAWSNQELGASNIEKSLLSYMQRQEDYQEKYDKTLAIFRQEGLDHLDISSMLKLKLREEKEHCVTQGEYPCISFLYSIVAKVTDFGQTDEYRRHKSDYRFDLEGVNIDSLIAPYKKCVENDFIQLKENIKAVIQGRSIDYVILSGGACQMPWVKDMVQTIFNPSLGIILDNAASFVVSKGIALYARAQMTAFDNYMEKIKNINFADIYSRADARASEQAVLALIPTMLSNLRNSSSVTGYKIRRDFCNFVEGLNADNEDYTELVEKYLNEAISSIVADSIQKVIQDVFSIRVDTSDVKVHVTPVIFNWDPSSFQIGGVFYDQFTQMIENSSDAFIFSFNWDKERFNPERDNIINATADFLKKYMKDDKIAEYPEETLNQYKALIRGEVLEQAENFFYKKQLFETTFKNSSNNNQCISM